MKKSGYPALNQNFNDGQFQSLINVEQYEQSLAKTSDVPMTS